MTDVRFSFRSLLSARHLVSSLLLLSLLPAGAVEVPLPPIPPIPAKQPIDSVPMGDSKNAPEFKLDLPIAAGPYQPTWESIEKNYPGTPDWLREAKFGIWVHFGPQAAGESGDWYARNLYKPSKAYDNHLKRYGHPSEVGYKDVLRNWDPNRLDPAKLVALYQEAGAKYLIVQGVHHDNFDLWNSHYQPWNATRMGPKRDLLGEWFKAARKADMHIGVSFHHEYNWWWWQTAFGSDAKGPKVGVPYDGNLTLADGKGKWWEGLDPRMLYGIDLREYQGVSAAAASPWNPPPAGLFTNHMAYAQWYTKWWALRMMDVVDQYHPDFIYTDGTGAQPFSGSHTGTGIKADAMQRVIAHFYNQTLKERGKVDVFSIVKFRPKTNGTVNTFENGLPNKIKTDQSWIGELPVGDWFYGNGFVYEGRAMIRYLVEAVSRDGSVAISIPIRPDGGLDDGCIAMLKDVGAWMRVNGTAIYGSHAWVRPGEGEKGIRQLPAGALGKNQATFPYNTKDFRFTVGKNGALYAICLAVPEPGSNVTITSLNTKEGLFGKPIADVKLLGDHGPALTWKQDAEGLVITCPATLPCATAVTFEIR